MVFGVWLLTGPRGGRAVRWFASVVGLFAGRPRNGIGMRSASARTGRGGVVGGRARSRDGGRLILRAFGTRKRLHAHGKQRCMDDGGSR